MNISVVSSVTTRLLMESKSLNCENQSLPLSTVTYLSPEWKHLFWNLSAYNSKSVKNHFSEEWEAKLTVRYCKRTPGSVTPFPQQAFHVFAEMVVKADDTSWSFLIN